MRSLFSTSQALLLPAAIVLGPALALWHLHSRWDPDGAYAYGWVVPFLALFLARLRWDDRPPASPPLAGLRSVAVACALLLLPTLWLQEAAPGRSICAWTSALASVGVSLSLITMTGGAAWLRWFSFPLAFLLTAVPWPHGLEVLVSNSLMHGTAGATVEILCLIGVPAAQAGNLVHIETGVIDIDEACSGIRSLQAMVMLALFLGELFRLRPARRLGLMVFGLTVTLLANVVRTVVLASIGFSQGMNAVDRYHDTAGLAVLLFSLSSTMLTAFLLRPRKTMARLPAARPAGFALPLQLSAALLAWFLVTEIAVEGWYRWHEPKWQGWSWAIQWPAKQPHFQFLPIPQRSLRLLSSDAAQAATWKEPDGSFWSLYWIRWNPGNPQAEAAKVHRPDVCLNAEGAVMERDLGTHLHSVGGLQIPFQSFTFRMGEETLYVFFCLFEEGTGEPTPASNPRFEETDMFQRALKGRRRVGQQSLEIAVSGYRSAQSAQEAFTARLEQLMQMRAGPISPAKE